jgi:hypothetical protein
MSQKLDEFRRLIRELVEEELEEMTGTGAVAGFYTPFAFQGTKAANKAKRRQTASQAGYTIADESGEEEDNKIFEATNISGWSVEDISFVTRGADPTHYQRYILRKGNKTYKVEEFFGDYYVSTDLKSKGRGPYTSKQADQLLRQVGAPTTDQIERSGKRYESINEANEPVPGDRVKVVRGKAKGEAGEALGYPSNTQDAIKVRLDSGGEGYFPIEDLIREGFEPGQKVIAGHWSGRKPSAGVITKKAGSGKVVVKWKTGEKEVVNINDLAPLNEAGDPYYPWRNDETRTPRMKIGKAIVEINRTLKEAERVVKRCGRLKKEMGLNANQYWKRTNNALIKIEGRVHKIAQKVREMRV